MFVKCLAVIFGIIALIGAGALCAVMAQTALYVDNLYDWAVGLEKIIDSDSCDDTATLYSNFDYIEIFYYLSYIATLATILTIAIGIISAKHTFEELSMHTVWICILVTYHAIGIGWIYFRWEIESFLSWISSDENTDVCGNSNVSYIEDGKFYYKEFQNSLIPYIWLLAIIKVSEIIMIILFSVSLNVMKKETLKEQLETQHAKTNVRSQSNLYNNDNNNYYNNNNTRNQPTAIQMTSTSGYNNNYSNNYNNNYNNNYTQPERRTNTTACCKCDTKFSFVKASTAYGTYSDSSISCDRCKKEVPGSQYAYHCPKGKTSEHYGGFDICKNCINQFEIENKREKQQNERRIQLQRQRQQQANNREASPSISDSTARMVLGAIGIAISGFESASQEHCDEAMVKLNNTRCSGRTHSRDAIALGFKKMVELKDYLTKMKKFDHNFIHIVLTDGEDTGSELSTFEFLLLQHILDEKGFDQICKTYFIGVGLSTEAEKELDSYSKIGGDHSEFYKCDAMEIDKIFNHISISLFQNTTLARIQTEQGALVMGRQQRGIKMGLNHFLVLFTLDISGSMAGSRWNAVKRSVKTLLDNLKSSDLFGIVLFNHETKIITGAASE